MKNIVYLGTKATYSYVDVQRKKILTGKKIFDFDAQLHHEGNGIGRRQPR